MMNKIVLFTKNIIKTNFVLFCVLISISLDLVYADNGDLYFTDPPYGFGLEKLLTSELKVN